MARTRVDRRTETRPQGSNQPQAGPKRVRSAENTPEASEIDKELLRALAQELLCRGLVTTPICEEVVDIIRRHRVEVLQAEYGASIRVSARHLGITDRNVTQLKHDKTGSSRDDDSLLVLTYTFVMSHFPGAVTAQQVCTYLRNSGHDIPLPSTATHLDLLCDLDILEKVGRRYRARYFSMVADPERQVRNLRELRVSGRLTWSVLRSFAHADPGSRHGRWWGVMDVNVLEQCTRRIAEVIAATIQEYTALSNQMESPHEVGWGLTLTAGILPEPVMQQMNRLKLGGALPPGGPLENGEGEMAGQVAEEPPIPPADTLIAGSDESTP